MKTCIEQSIVLSLSKGRNAENESPQGSLERLSRLEQVMAEEIDELKGLLE